MGTGEPAQSTSIIPTGLQYGWLALVEQTVFQHAESR